MSAEDNLPVILVSAGNAASASALITEIIHDGTEPQCNGASHDNDEDSSASVWHLSNKYYSATVRLRPLTDNAVPDPRDDVQAHIIYLTEDECSDNTVCAQRAAAAHASRNAVRLVAARTSTEPPALAVWARASHYELVPLLAPPAERKEHEPFPESTGVARVREALHAHAWPGMRRAGAVRTPPPDLHEVAASCDYKGDLLLYDLYAVLVLSTDDSSSSSNDSWGSWRRARHADDDEAAAVERAQEFADVLAMLPTRRDATEHNATRLLHAEQVVVALCRALGHELDLDVPDPTPN